MLHKHIGNYFKVATSVYQVVFTFILSKSLYLYLHNN